MIKIKNEYLLKINLRVSDILNSVLTVFSCEIKRNNATCNGLQ